VNKRRLNNRSIKDDIIKLRKKGKTYNEISKTLQCSKSVISYHCGKDGTEKERVKNFTKNRNPLCKKVSNFRTRCSRANYKALQSKFRTFKRKPCKSGNHTNTIVNSINKNYTCKDVINKLGENPVCYLTGEKIDLNKPSTYNLDHIVPSSKGGTNDLSNLGVCLREANFAKGDLSVDELFILCQKILTYRDKCKE
jgi:CRISPR/Cas system Type II protein with McrA/HNH and RuvC-like nuclease domain